MKGRAVVVSTVGTSLLTHGEHASALGELLRRTANATEADLAPGDRRAITDRVRRVAELLADAGSAEASRLSAELNGLHRLLGDLQSCKQAELVHWLVATDTYQGREAARLVKDYLNARGWTVHLLVCERLSTRSRASFTAGIQQLIRWCEENLSAYRTAGYRIVFNLVGAFKSLQAYMNTLGMFYADEIVYVFEAEDSPLIRIPRLPVQLTPDACIEKKPLLFAQMANGKVMSLTELADIPEALLEIDETGHAILNEWGLFVWERSKHKVLAGPLLNLPRLSYTPAFRRDYDGIRERSERVRLQEALVQISELLETNNNDLACLRRHPSILYEDYVRTPGIGHLRVSLATRICCEKTGNGLKLLRYGQEERINP
ncbi:MAG: CRISPR-associated protein [Bacillota bacterium]